VQFCLVEADACWLQIRDLSEQVERLNDKGAMQDAQYRNLVQQHHTMQMRLQQAEAQVGSVRQQPFTLILGSCS